MPRLEDYVRDARVLSLFRLSDPPIVTVEQLLMTNISEGQTRNGLRPEDVERVITEAVRGCAAQPTICLPSATRRCISSGYHGLDDLLGGGFYTKEISEVFGQSMSGKSRLCMTAAASLVLQNSVAYVEYITPAGDLTGRVIHRILRERVSQGENQQSTVGALDRIRLWRAYDLFDLFGSLQEIERSAQESRKPLLIIIDSMSHYFSPYSGTGKDSTSAGQSMLAHGVHLLKQMAHLHGISILVTNTTVQGRTSHQAFKPALGEAWAMHPLVKVELRFAVDHSQGDYGTQERIAIIRKSPRSIRNSACRLSLVGVGVG